MFESRRRVRSSTARRSVLLGLALSVVLFLQPEAPAEETRSQFRVIVNESSPVTTLSRSQVSKLLLKESTRWKDGTAALPVDLARSSPARSAFNQDIHGRTDQAVASYWQRQIFSGAKVPPPVLLSDEEVVRFVGENPGAIGYVSRDVRLERVRELTVTDS